MATQLPGSSSGRTAGLSVTKAGLRLIGGTDLADVIADLTGLSARRVKSLARDGTRQLQQSGQVKHEYRKVAANLAGTYDEFRKEPAG
jgi:hypothetical protein